MIYFLLLSLIGNGILFYKRYNKKVKEVEREILSYIDYRPGDIVYYVDEDDKYTVKKKSVIAIVSDCRGTSVFFNKHILQKWMDGYDDALRFKSYSYPDHVAKKKYHSLIEDAQNERLEMLNILIDDQS